MCVSLYIQFHSETPEAWSYAVFHHWLSLCQGVMVVMVYSIWPELQIGGSDESTNSCTHTQTKHKHIQCKVDRTVSPVLENRLSVFTSSTGTPQGTSGPVIVRDAECFVLPRFPRAGERWWLLGTMLWVDVKPEFNEDHHYSGVQSHFLQPSLSLSTGSARNPQPSSEWWNPVQSSETSPLVALD